MSSTITIPEVLTLDEVGNYLRLPKETVEHQATRGKIPGRRIEESWRFLMLKYASQSVAEFL